jgi:hypothetical protein
MFEYVATIHSNSTKHQYSQYRLYALLNCCKIINVLRNFTTAGELIITVRSSEKNDETASATVYKTLAKYHKQ